MKPILIILLSLVATQVSAQAFELTLSNAIREISLSEIPGDTEIRNAAGNKLKIELVFADAARRPSQVIPGSTDNTGKGLHYELNGNKITFISVWPGPVEGKYIIEIPAGIALIVQGPTIFRKSLDITDFKGNLDIRSEHDVTITGLTTGLILHNSAGQVAVKTGASKIQRPISIITQSGNVVFLMPRRMGVNLKIGTGTGRILGTLVGRGGTTKINATQFSTTLNGGGTDVQIQSLSGNVKIEQF
jgi:hypothetical protein